MSKSNSNSRFVKKRNLPFYISLATKAALLAAISVPSYAQDDSETDPDSEDKVVEEIVVTGLRSSLESAQTIKRDAELVVDSITASDIGALPDRSVAEALQRIPGVQLQRTNSNRDPARLAAEGGGVFVRGLSWVRTELNGRDVFSASSGQSLGFEDVSADLMAGVDVYKNSTADTIEGGLGGLVNLRTRKPFDQSGPVLAASADYNYADMLDEGFTSFSAIGSNTWDTDAGEVGLLVSLSLGRIGNRTDSVQTGRYDADSPNDDPDTPEIEGETFYLPTSIGFRRIDWEQERNAVSSAVQWAPSDEATFTFEALYATVNPIDYEYAVGVTAAGQSDLKTWSGDYDYDSRNMLESGTVQNATLAFNTRYGERDSTTADYSLKFEYQPSEKWSFSTDLQYIKSEATVLSMTAFTAPAAERDTITDTSLVGTNFPDVGFDFTASDPWISIDQQNLLAQQDEYWWAAAMDHLEDNEAESVALRGDAEYTFEDDGLLRSFKFGARGTNKDAITRQTGYNWGLLSNQYWLQSQNPAFLDSYSPGQSQLVTFDDFMRGDIAVPSVGWFPSDQLVSDNNLAYRYLVDTKTSGWGWTPYDTPAAYYEQNPRADNVSAGVNDQNEKTFALYGMLRFGDESGDFMGIPFDGNIGVRWVRTDVTTQGRANSGGAPSPCDDVAPLTNCADAQSFADAYNSEYGGYRDFENEYDNFLPSLNLRFLFTEELQFRLGYSKGMVRPSFSQTRPYTNIEFDFQGNVFDPNTVDDGYVGTMTSGASDLEPTTADQYDASLEWYFNNSSSLTFAAFYKDIKDYIVVENAIVEMTSGGQAFPFRSTRNINADDGQLSGFELAYQQFYDFLPEPFDGLGLQANFTYIDNEGGGNTAFNVFEEPQAVNAVSEDLPIEGMSKTSYNVALMYEKYDVSARLAYNWRERYMLTTSAANLNVPTWYNDYGQLDGSIFYSISDHLKIGLQATNLLQSESELEVGFPARIGDYSWTQTDRRVAFVIRAQM